MKKILVILLISYGCTSTKNQETNCKGPAKEGCMCTMQYDPVCGCDKKTYSNACVAGCAGVISFTKGACAP